MRRWDLTTPAAKLEEAMEKLQAARAVVADQWDDETSRAFQDRFLVGLEPQVRRVQEGLRRLAEVLARAERDCQRE